MTDPVANVTRSEHQVRVRQFMVLAGQATPDVPAMCDEKTRILRVKILHEEFLEFAHAMGVTIIASRKGRPDLPNDYRDVALDGDRKTSNLTYTVTHAPDLVEAADAIADISVVNAGGAIALGISDIALLEAVDRSNLDKFGPGGYRDEDGKWIKPPGHAKPNFAAVLREQGWTGS